jgi:hypothetical protein
MGQLRGAQSKQTSELEPEHLIGRSPKSSLVIDHERVSAQHAVLRWTGSEWTLRDLSRNGTFVDGARITREPHPLALGMKLWFGSADVEWELVDATAPRPLLVSVDDGSSLWIEGDLLALPSHDNPVATVFRDGNGIWNLERPEGNRRLFDSGDTFVVDGRTWRFRSATTALRTTAAIPEGATMPKLLFAVSSDEEHVELVAEIGERRIPLGTSSRYYLLLTLARQRAADRAQGLPETSCGWMHHEDLQRALALSQQHLNVDVFRIRRQLSEKGLAGAATIIERRPRSRQLRLGPKDFEITRL